MPRGSEALTRARRDEIVNACAALYQTMSFRDITLRDIGEKTSFTRTSIYNYFQTKEEIFLALLQREYEAWAEDLEALCRAGGRRPPEAFPGGLARTLEGRGTMLKLLCMNLYDMEANTRLENLVAFKRAYGASLAAVGRCLEAWFPAMTAQEIHGFLYAFFPFLFGVYPYTQATEKQQAAMEAAGIEPPGYTVPALVEALAEKLLAPWLRQGQRDILIPTK